MIEIIREKKIVIKERLEKALIWLFNQYGLEPIRVVCFYSGKKYTIRVGCENGYGDYNHFSMIFHIAEPLKSWLFSAESVLDEADINIDIDSLDTAKWEITFNAKYFNNNTVNETLYGNLKKLVPIFNTRTHVV